MIHKISFKSDNYYYRGVTLIELLVTLFVIALLASAVYPSLQQHVVKGHRVQAMSDLMAIQLQLERSYTGSYDLTLIEAGSCSVCDSDIARYTISYTTGSGMDRYRIVATPTSQTVQESDRCGTLSINAAGVRSAYKDADFVEGCW
jgi:type IV pilus assembly protein PilE